MSQDEQHPDTIADRVLMATLNGVVTDPIALYRAAREAYRQRTGANPGQAREAIRRAAVRAALRADDQALRIKGMAVHTRR